MWIVPKRCKVCMPVAQQLPTLVYTLLLLLNVSQRACWMLLSSFGVTTNVKLRRRGDKHIRHEAGFLESCGRETCHSRTTFAGYGTTLTFAVWMCWSDIEEQRGWRHGGIEPVAVFGWRTPRPLRRHQVRSIRRRQQAGNGWIHKWNRHGWSKHPCCPQHLWGLAAGVTNHSGSGHSDRTLQPDHFPSRRSTTFPEVGRPKDVEMLFISFHT